MTEVYYPIKWFVNVLKIRDATFNLGYCTYGKGIAFISDEILTPMLVTDIIAYNDYCSDAKWCLNISCPLNRYDLKYLRKYGVMNEKELKILHRRLKEVEEKLEEAGFSFENAGDGMVVFKKPAVEVRRCSGEEKEKEV